MSQIGQFNKAGWILQAPNGADLAELRFLESHKRGYYFVCQRILSDEIWERSVGFLNPKHLLFNTETKLHLDREKWVVINMDGRPGIPEHHAQTELIIAFFRKRKSKLSSLVEWFYK